MTVYSLEERRAQNRAAADAVFADVELEIRAARDAIMTRALRRIAGADGQASLQPAVQRLGRLWVNAWPLET